MFKKYGVEYTFQTENNKIKSKQTCLKKYGDPNYRNIHINKDIIRKQIETKRKNGSYTVSKQENECYTLLLTIFDSSDIMRQYRDELYPFACDFYIKSINTYIEYNGFWTHGGHPYDENNEQDISILNNWKSKNDNFYKQAVFNWTQSDIKKRTIAKQNNLNYIEFYNIDQVKEWINNYGR